MTNRIVETLRSEASGCRDLIGRVFGDARELMVRDLSRKAAELDLAANAIEKGLVWHADQTKPGYCAPSCHDLAQALDAIAREGAA